MFWSKLIQIQSWGAEYKTGFAAYQANPEAFRTHKEYSMDRETFDTHIRTHPLLCCVFIVNEQLGPLLFVITCSLLQMTWGEILLYSFNLKSYIYLTSDRTIGDHHSCE